MTKCPICLESVALIRDGSGNAKHLPSASCPASGGVLHREAWERLAEMTKEAERARR